MATCAGYAPAEPEAQPQIHPRPQRPGGPVTESVLLEGEVISVRATGLVGERPQARFYRVVEHLAVPPEARVSEAPDWFLRAAPFTEPVQADPRGRPPPLEPLVPWRRLWPFLRAALGRISASGRPDLERAVALVARGRVLRRLPFRRRQRWSPAAQILVDYSPRLAPFWDDLTVLLGALIRLRGRAGLEVLKLEEGPAGPCRRWGGRGAEVERLHPYALPEAGTPVLILSDLGCLDGVAERAAWERLGRRLVAAGLAPVVLIPCPRPRWDAAVLRWYSPVIWDRTERMPQRLGRRPTPPQARQAERQSKDPGAERLLTLLSPAIRVEPVLLRAVRLRLPPGWANVGSEAAAWAHPAIVAACTAFAYADGDAIEEYREGFRRQPPELQRLAAQQIERFHAHLSGVVRYEERQVIAELMGEPDPQAEAFLARVIRTLDQAAEQDPALRQRMNAWVRRFAGRQHAAGWKDPVRTAVYVRALSAELKTEDAALPDGLDINLAAWALDPPAVPERYRLWQRGEAFELEPAAAILSPPSGSLITKLHIAASVVQVLDEPGSATETGRWRSVALAGPEPRASITLPGNGGLVIKTDHDTIRIEPLTRPAWASAMGRDGEGLFVEVGEGESARRAYWFNPGTYPILDRGGAEVGTLTLPRGYFLDRTEFEAFPEGFRQPDWADTVGVDDYGLYADFSIEGVTQRMRWIPPGEFRMGSPADEPKRYNDERQHEVVLTRGFWLAETACTQALWEAVMGENRSHFKGPEQPVESVSWEDVQRFIMHLNERVPGLEVRLPTEAEWEYACRAGTKTPFWFGNQITPEQANYDGSYPYAGGKKGVYREETVEVKALPANGWGLYQMHGNVWEWCADWYGEYPEGTVVDPSGPQGGADRVLRGGGWIGNGRGLRSADRIHDGPGDRSDRVGFRLARGQSSRGAEPQSGTGASRTGQTKRSGVGQGRRSGRRQ
jgi:formylglycine-generating enzyme required for sulfatase activity